MDEKYKKYLESDEWANKKEEIYNKRGKQCIICGSTYNLNVHHLNYETIYCEEINDFYNVIVVCEKCHKKLHEMLYNMQDIKYENENKTPIWEVRQEQYLEYMRLTQKLLLYDKSLLDYIYNKRGLTSDTLDLCGIGYDNTEESFTIPIFSNRYGCITDFELRKYSDKKQIKRVGGGCNTIACIYGIPNAKEAYIVEGMLDGITLCQWLLDKKHDDIIIYSCSNGVGSLINVMNEINFSRHKEIKLILDNDEAGDKATKDIIDKYPFIKDCRKFLVDSNCNDISEYYVKKVR